jgi:hypothetical protein
VWTELESSEELRIGLNYTGLRLETSTAPPRNLHKFSIKKSQKVLFQNATKLASNRPLDGQQELAAHPTCGNNVDLLDKIFCILD